MVNMIQMMNSSCVMPLAYHKDKKRSVKTMSPLGSCSEVIKRAKRWNRYTPVNCQHLVYCCCVSGRQKQTFHVEQTPTRKVSCMNYTPPQEKNKRVEEP